MKCNKCETELNGIGFGGSCKGVCFRCMMREYPTLQAEIERLRAIVDELPKTADGVPVVPGEDVVWHPTVRSDNGRLMPMAIDLNEGAAWYRVPDDRKFVCDCYSTREAAEVKGGQCT